MAMPDLPRQPKVPVWVTDDRWNQWHVWLPAVAMTDEGRALTACHAEWYWSATATTSYQIMAEAGCDACRQAVVGQPVPRTRGRPRRLPQGPLPPRAPRLARPVTLSPPPGDKVEPPKAERAPMPTRAQRAARVAEESELEFTFEVGRRLPSWPCMQCGQVLASGDRFCSTWCSKEHVRENFEARSERTGRAMARRQFEDMLYGRKRRDSIRSWTPPVRQIKPRSPQAWRDLVDGHPVTHFVTPTVTEYVDK